MIITEIKQLQLMCEEVKTIKEGEEIGAQLLKELNKWKKRKKAKRRAKND